MNYYVLTQKKDRGCPVGMLNAALYDRFYDKKEIEKIKYGEFNWYAGSGFRDGARIYSPLPDGLCFISKDKLYDFDLRADPHRFYVMSEEFVKVSQKTKVVFEACAATDVKNRGGERISSKNYYIVRLAQHALDAAIDVDHSELFGEKSMLKIRKLKIKNDFDQSLFKLKGMDPSYDAVFCSEEFRSEALKADAKGIDFVDLSTAVWPGFRIV